MSKKICGSHRSPIVSSLRRSWKAPGVRFTRKLWRAGIKSCLVKAGSGLAEAVPGTWGQSVPLADRQYSRSERGSSLVTHLVTVTACGALPSAEGTEPAGARAHLGFHNLCSASMGSGDFYSTHVEAALFNYPCLIADHSQQDFFLSKYQKTLWKYNVERWKHPRPVSPLTTGGHFGMLRPFAIASHHLLFSWADAQRGNTSGWWFCSWWLWIRGSKTKAAAPSEEGGLMHFNEGSALKALEGERFQV